MSFYSFDSYDHPSSVYVGRCEAAYLKIANGLSLLEY